MFKRQPQNGEIQAQKKPASAQSIKTSRIPHIYANSKPEELLINSPYHVDPKQTIPHDPPQIPVEQKSRFRLAETYIKMREFLLFVVRTSSVIVDISNKIKKGKKKALA